MQHIISSPRTRRNRFHAAIDIGSNSVRLEIYQLQNHIILPVVTEKHFCQLGRGLQETGHLDPEGRKMAQAVLARFAQLLSAWNVKNVAAVATAAIRNAKDGADFIDSVAQIAGIKIKIISGEEEARLAAYGVLAGTDLDEAIIGDLGGGSLELVLIKSRKIIEQASLPLGPLMLDSSCRTRQEAEERIQKELATITWLENVQKLPLYAVGGIWRSFAKAYMEEKNWPLRHVHLFTQSADNIRAYLADFIVCYPKSARNIPTISKRRLEHFPHAALVLDQIIARIHVSQVIYSAYGLREGLAVDKEKLDTVPTLLDQWPPYHQLSSAEHENITVLYSWLEKFPQPVTGRLDKLLTLACYLQSVCWQETPEWRSEFVLNLVLRLPVIHLQHEERICLALLLFYAFGGKDRQGQSDPYRKFLQETMPEDWQEIRLWAEILRLGLTLCGGALSLLERTSWKAKNGCLSLVTQDSFLPLVGDTIEKRLAKIAKLAGYTEHDILLGS